MSAAQEKVAVETGVGVATAYLLDGDKGGPLSSILVKNSVSYLHLRTTAVLMSCEKI